MWGKNAGWMTLGENLGKKGLTAINLGQEKDGAILKRPDVDISSDLSAVHECYRRTDMPLANPTSFLYSKYVIYQ